MTRSIAIYCRVSTDEQAREGVSLEEQQERLAAYCKAMGWTQQILLYVDDGYSAKNTDRPALNRLLTAIRQGRIAKVMVTKLDRLSRRLLDLLTLIELFGQHQVSFVSTSESFDTDTPSGRLTLQVLGAVAEFERERIRERVFDNMHHAARNGKWLTQSPYGYRLEQKELIIHEQEAEVVRRVYDLYLNQGLGYLTIAKRLNEEGIPSPHKKEWSLRAIKLMLTNPAYKGTLMWNRTDSSTPTRTTKDEEEWVIVPDCLPVIIDPSVWEQVQRRIAKPPVASRAQTSPHLLGGLLACGHCGASMSIGYSGWPKRHRVYRCSAHKNKGTCHSTPYRADQVELRLKQALDKLFRTLPIPRPLLPMLTLSTPSHSASGHGQRLKKAQARYKRKVEAYANGLIDLDDLTAEKTRLDKETAAAVPAPDNPNTLPADLQLLNESFSHQLSHTMDAFSLLPVETAKALLQTLVEKVTIHKEGAVTLRLRLPSQIPSET
ncbi:recombinase family protein [Brevibacillus dissolubilis]|uniref:recombinase family protein n=1 Tax=Brevibacillus dissolubilis TaxID=1844116 RepID=UPI0011175A5A|nr:recombinase family protein [Brevibacillus dissolubilis]